MDRIGIKSMRYPDDFVNKIICGNSLEIMKDIPTGSIDFVLTDPPYIISSTVKIRRKRNSARISKGLDSRRGIVIGNAVTVNVAEWIGKRIIKYAEEH